MPRLADTYMGWARHNWLTEASLPAGEGFGDATLEASGVGARAESAISSSRGKSSPRRPEWTKILVSESLESRVGVSAIQPAERIRPVFHCGQGWTISS